MKEYSLFCRLSALVVFICVVQFLMLMIWSSRINTPVDYKVTKFTSSTLREVRKLFRHNMTMEHQDVDVMDNYPSFNNRVAILIPYLGDKLPAWFNTFIMTASSSSSLCDWLIFITDAPLIETPSNVKLIQLSKEDIYNRLARLDIKRYVSDAEFMQLSVQKLIESHPYVLVEFKPCLGFLFNDYIQSYSHWAYADLDTLMGRVEEHLTQEHLNTFDMISYSFGDNYRLYLRGQLTIMRNAPVTNNLWKNCEHLSSLGSRLDKFIQPSSNSNDKSGWRFQSGEGCISRVAMDSSNVSIAYLSSQLSDAFSASTKQKESLLLGHSLVRCHKEGIDLSKEYDSIINFMSTNTNRRDSVGRLELEQSISEVNTPLSRINGIRCSYWIEPSFDVCVEDLPSTANVVKRVSSGVKSELSYHIAEYGTIGNGECREASIVHFQGWKHNYGGFVTRLPSSDTQVMLITDSGLIPLRISEVVGDNENIKKLPSFADLYDKNVLYAGRLIPSDIRSTKSPTALDSSSNNNLRVRTVLDNSYGGMSGKKMISRLVYKGVGLSTHYCGGFSHDLKNCACHIHYGDIELLQRTSQSYKSNAVTMVLVGWDFDLYDRSLDSILSGWEGPKIIVLAKTKTASTVPSAAKEASILLVDVRRCLEYINQDASPPHYILPDKVLYNIALDVVKTDLVFIVPAIFHTTRRVNLRSWKGSSAGVAVQLRQKLQLLHSQLGVKLSTNVFTIPNSPALIIPMYTAVDDDSISDLSVEEQQLLSNGIPTLTKYPLTNSWCGESQPTSLQLPFEMVVSEVFEPYPLPFDSMELLKEKTLVLSVLFNMTAGPHGRDFVRFPEELSGHGCFGASMLRILAGSGYSLHWSTSGVYMSIGNKIREAAPDGDFVLNEIACGCSFGNDVTAMRDFTNKMNRAVELRSKGIGSVFTGEPFGKQFEKNTMKQ